MGTNKTEELYDELQTILARGDEAGARVFIDAHINEFPEDIQQKIALSLFEESLDDLARARAVRDDLQKQGLEASAMLDSDERNLEDQLKINEINAKLNT